MWQIIGLATALQTPILSVYPEQNMRIRTLFNVCVQPLIGSASSQTLAIFWSGYVTENGFTPNHFVPLIKKNLLQRSTNSTTLNKMKRPGYPMSHTSSQKKTKQSIASNIQTTPHCTSKNTSHNFKVNVTSSFTIENKHHSLDMNINLPAQPHDTEPSINPTPWCQPTDCKSIDFMKKNSI